VGLRSRQRTRVVWSSGRAAGQGVQEVRRSARGARIRWWLRTGVLLAIIGLMRLGRTARTYPRPAISLAGTMITVAGISLPSGAVLISGFLVLFLALFMPPARAAAPAKLCSSRLWSSPCTPFAPSGRHRPPPS
jgi:hypothetical protein